MPSVDLYRPTGHPKSEERRQQRHIGAGMHTYLHPPGSPTHHRASHDREVDRLLAKTSPKQVRRNNDQHNSNNNGNNGTSSSVRRTRGNGFARGRRGRPTDVGGMTEDKIGGYAIWGAYSFRNWIEGMGL